jgi:hypothetical protein
MKRIFCVIRGEGLIPKSPPSGGGASGAVIKVLNPRPIPLENNIPRRTGGPSSAAGLLIAVVLFLLPLALPAQEFNPAGSPLEGVWENETDDEDVIIFTGNLILEKNRDSTYSVYPGIEYENGKVYSPTQSDVFTYKLSGNTLTLTGEYDDVTRYKRSDNAILQNKSRLEGVWSGQYQPPYGTDEALELSWIIIGGLLIELVKENFFIDYSDAIEFIYSASDDTITALETTISCMVSGDVMTLLTDDSVTVVLTRRK